MRKVHPRLEYRTVEQSLQLLQLSQRSHDEGGMTRYNVVASVTDSDDDELLHEYCAYHPMAGPVLVGIPTAGSCL